jgi:hypothetical protein
LVTPRNVWLVLGRAACTAGLTAALGVGLPVTGSGCGTTAANVLTDAEGEPIDLAQVNEILNDSELDNSEKRDDLRELGLSDSVIDVLLSANG